MSNDSKSIDQILADGWSQLHYLYVNIDGLSRDVAALDDSDAQICVIRADLAQELQLVVVGQVTIHGVTSDAAINADVVSLKIKLTQAKTYIPVTCAMCSRLQ